MTIEQKVAEWNTQYDLLMSETKIKDMGPAGYEEIVGYELLLVCDNDVDLALAVFNHENNQGGWAMGDVSAFLERKR